MTTGEGGMVTTDDDGVDSHIRKLRNHHQTKTPEEKKQAWEYDVDGLGFNFRMSEFQAAIGLSQLERLPEMTESRQDVAQRYRDSIEDIDGIMWEGTTTDRNHVFHLFVVRVTDEFPVSRDELYHIFQDSDIVTGVHYPSISLFSYYQETEGEFDSAEDLTEEILSLPMYPNMEIRAQDRVLEVLRENTS
jgi:dTDP-4-amino-4,6-dideoxygalactose transaminase